MSAKPPRIYTCTPFSFHGNGYFFTRDTGLLCRNLQALGAESRAVMPLPAREDDLPDAPLIRVPMRRLKSTAWWRAQGLDGVMLYSWGDPRYTGVARAIHRAGIRLVIHYDANCELHGHLKRPGGAVKRLVNRVKDTLINRLRARHLGYADAITTTPANRDAFLHDPAYGERIAAKCVEMPCPISPVFRCEGQGRERLFVAVGNWSDVVNKRPEMLMATLDAYYATTDAAVLCDTEVYGIPTPEMLAWHAALPPHVQPRVRLMGNVDHATLCRAYNRARASLCTSYAEGTHNASLEAHCCGAAVVCPNRPILLCNVIWYTQDGGGTVSAEDTPQSLAAALQAESAAWDAGRRDPAGIAAAWQPKVLPPLTLPGLFPGTGLRDGGDGAKTS